MKKVRKLSPVNWTVIAAVAVLLILAVLNAIRIGGGYKPQTQPVSAAAPGAEYPLAVYFVSVGEGDGAVIRCGDTVLVVDGGEREQAETMNTFLASLGVDTVDCYIATHPHSDHIGAAAGIFNAVRVKSAMLTPFSEINTPTTDTYERLLNAIETQGSEVILPAAGDVYDFGELKLTVVAPVEETGDYNNMSIVFKLEYGKTSFLFTGDMEKESEALVLEKGFDIGADVLKVAHHGSTSSTTPAFLDAVSPRLAVISCGKNNDYGHPHKEILSLLQDEGIEYRRTDLSGTVTVYSDGKDVFVKE